MDGEGWHLVEVECVACSSAAVGTLRVSENIHPDQIIAVCQEHGALCVEILSDLATIDYLDERERARLGNWSCPAREIL